MAEKSFYVAQMEQNPIDGLHAAQMEQIRMDCHLQNELECSFY